MPRLVQGIFELLAGAETGLLGRLDRDFLARLRIAAFAARALRHHEDAKARQSYSIAALKRLGNEVKYAIYGFRRIVLHETRAVRKLLNEVVLVHGMAPFTRVALRGGTLGRAASPAKGKTQGNRGNL